MKRFTLHIGCANAFDAVLRIVYPRFDSFTILDRRGVFRDRPEPGLLVEVATNDGLGVIATAQAICAALNPTDLGIEYDGRYCRCREDDAVQDLQQQLGCEANIPR